MPLSDATDKAPPGPYRRCQPAPIPCCAGAVQFVHFTTMHPSAIRVCLVEDSSLVRLRLAGMLRDLWDVERVFEAATVAEARRLLPTAKPHLVVVDMRLPDGDGLEVVAAAKRLTPQPAVVVLTSYGYDQLRATCLEAGADQFLDKRTEFDRLPAIVAELCAHHDPRAGAAP